MSLGGVQIIKVKERNINFGEYISLHVLVKKRKVNNGIGDPQI